MTMCSLRRLSLVIWSMNFGVSESSLYKNHSEGWNPQPPVVKIGGGDFWDFHFSRSPESHRKMPYINKKKVQRKQ